MVKTATSLTSDRMVETLVFPLLVLSPVKCYQLHSIILCNTQDLSCDKRRSTHRYHPSSPSATNSPLVSQSNREKSFAKLIYLKNSITMHIHYDKSKTSEPKLQPLHSKNEVLPRLQLFILPLNGFSPGYIWALGISGQS